MAKNFKPMLAGKVGSTINFPVVASPKLDGVRCIVIKGVAMSRSLKPIPNRHVQKMLSKGFDGLDGELLLGPVGAPDVYRKTVSAVMTEEGEPRVTFWAFDYIYSDAPFAERFTDHVKPHHNKGIVKVVEHRKILTMEQLDAFEARQLDDGLEGVMIRDPNGPYKQGRSTTNEGYLLKLKRFEDSEAHILDVQELLHNDNEAKKNALGHTERSSHKDNMVPMGTLGALLVRDIKTKVEFAIGTGYDAATRQELWDARKSLKGKIVKYKYFATGSKDKPRFPVFIGFRDKRDM